ncbi:hypothetical protein KI387_037525, partial [Taxus chinensis]
MLEDPINKVPEGTMASCHQAPQYTKGHHMMFVRGYKGYRCRANAQGHLEPIPTRHFKSDKHGLGLKSQGAQPVE